MSQPTQLMQQLNKLSNADLLKLSPVKTKELTGLELYCPHVPFPKQRTFLDLDCLEAMYGGGAGPGKTDALLMAALQYTHIPGYSALILRRDFPRLSLPGSIMDRAREWLTNTNAVHNKQERTYRFPSGAVLQFGYIDSPEDRFRYASSEYQFIGWDELTEFRLGADEGNVYQFMFSRLRKSLELPVPLRMRSATNPGNIGHAWVKQRFVTPEALEALRDNRPQVFYSDEGKTRAFVPALLNDNPYIDRDAYIQGLMHLPAVTRARLLQGDWSIVEDAIIRPEWLRYYDTRGQILRPLNIRREPLDTIIDERECVRIATVDTAGTSKQKADEKKGKPPSWSVCQVWDYWPKYDFMFLRHQWRARVNWDGLVVGVGNTLMQWRPHRTLIENAHHGPPLYHEMIHHFNGVELINPVTPDMKGQTGLPGKVERATSLLGKLERGLVFLPADNNSFVPDLELEWLSWTGLEDEAADQIDAASYAANDTKRGVGRTLVLDGPLLLGGF